MRGAVTLSEKFELPVFHWAGRYLMGWAKAQGLTLSEGLALMEEAFPFMVNEQLIVLWCRLRGCTTSTGILPPGPIPTPLRKVSPEFAEEAAKPSATYDQGKSVLRSARTAIRP